MNTEYRRRLPHIQPDGAVYYVTFRLKGTLPSHLIEALNQDLESQNHSMVARQDYKNTIEENLDNENYGPTWLKQSEVAQVVADSLHFYNGSVYKLICFCIMSNHVHFIGYSFKKPLHKFMQNLKTYTATKANKILDQKGSFWQREYFDRIVRDHNDLHNKIKYVINNPVQAGLISHWKQWSHTYCNKRFIDDLF